MTHCDLPACTLLLAPYGLCLVVTSFYLFPVKYLREVTPYIRKASLLSDIGWDLQRPFLSMTAQQHLQHQTKPDTRTIPLLLCYLTRQLKVQDSNDGRIIEIHSPDGLHSCLLRAGDAVQAAQW